MFKLLHRKKNYPKPKNNKNKTKYWKFALTDTSNKLINKKINESRRLYKSNIIVIIVIFSNNLITSSNVI